MPTLDRDIARLTGEGMERLRVVTLNIWGTNGPWEARRALIREGLESLQPDLVGLQEVQSLGAGGSRLDQGVELAEGLGFYLAYGPASESDDRTQGNALLSRYPIVDEAVVRLPDPQESGERRSLLFAAVDTPVGAVPVFVTHLSWQLELGHVRRRQAMFVAQQVDELAPPTGAHRFPPVLMGDFNAPPEADEIRFLAGLTSLDRVHTYFIDAWAWAHPGEPGATFDLRNGYAQPSGLPTRRIDYVFVRGRSRQPEGKPRACRVVLHEPRDGVWPSDHYGVCADLAVPGST